MKKLLTIELSQEWVLKHRADDVLPIALLEKELTGYCEMTVKEKSYTQLTLVFDENAASETAIKQKIGDVINKYYVGDMPALQLNISKENNSEETVDNQSDEQKNDDHDFDFDLPDDFFEMLKTLDGSDDDDDDDDDSKDKQTADKQMQVIAQIDDLIGAAEFKQIAHEIVKIAPEVRARKTFDIFSSQCYLFSIGDGCGTTTCVGLLAKLLSEVGIRDANTRVTEHKLPADRDTSGYDPFDEIKDILNRGSKKNLSVLCIDICEWMNFTERGKFRELLRLIEKASDRFIVVFRIPFVEKDVLERIQASLSDLLYVRAVTFPPLTRSELQLGAKKILANYGFTIQKSAWQYFDKRIAMEKSDGKFYEINTVKKIVNELIYKKQLHNAKSGKQSSVITAKDVKDICPVEVIDELTSGEAQLKALIGNEKIRVRLDEVLAQIELAMKSDTERPCIHMRFVGNPGTGKTTVARILGKILKERGILRIGNFYEYAGRDFCGRYVGETAPKTASMCRDAYGSVLFIDEAYTLYKEGSTVDYGREAIDTLIAEMENHRNDFIVIMAGYTDEMNTLMQGNLGLASRMPYTIEFPNFTRGELYGIFENMVTSKFKYDDKLLPAVKEYFENLPDNVINAKSFSNARYVRNLFERTWAKASLRCQLEGKSEVVLTRDDFERASNDNEFSKQEKKRSRIGF